MKRAQLRLVLIDPTEDFDTQDLQCVAINFYCFNDGEKYWKNGINVIVLEKTQGQKIAQGKEVSEELLKKMKNHIE